MMSPGVSTASNTHAARDRRAFTDLGLIQTLLQDLAAPRDPCVIRDLADAQVVVGPDLQAVLLPKLVVAHARPQAEAAIHLCCSSLRRETRDNGGSGSICRRLPGPLGRDIRANGPPLRALSRGQLNPSSAGLVEFEVAA